MASSQFAGAARQSQLLSYLVEEKLAGRSGQIKGYGIGIDVFGKDSSFDPSEDSIVRVHMSKLRALLAEYYLAEGGQDDPIFVLKPGDYEPKFAAPKNPQQPEQPSKKTNWTVSTHVTPERAIILALVAIIFAMWFWNDLTGQGDAAVQAAKRPDGPSIAVGAFEVNGTQRNLAQQLRGGLQYEIVSSLAQLPNLAVLGHDTVDNKAFLEPADRSDADFVLTGTITVDDTGFIVSSNLIRTKDQVVVWSQRTDRTALDPASFLTTKSRIAIAIAAELGEPYGAIHQDMRNNNLIQQDVLLADYFCELRAYDYMQSKDAVERAEVRACLQDAIARTPRYSDALALLSWIEGEEGRLAFGRSGSENDKRYAALSLDLAERAVRADTTNAMAYAQLAMAQYFGGNDETSAVSIERALRLSPNNTEILANAAWLYASWGNPETAIPLSEKAISLNPSHPPWYWLGLALCALDTGDKPEALRMAGNYRQENSLHARYIQAAAYRLSGRGEDADQMLAAAGEQFKLLQPELRANIRVWRLPDETVKLALGETGG